MMRVSKVLGSVVASAFVLAAVVASAPSQAGGDESLVELKCVNGNVTVTAAKPWHTNKEAPWKWDKGSKIEVNDQHAKFKGDKCEGTVKAFICSGDQCKGPIAVPVK
jgi:DUF4097 and DUF4098 domain-containing protein YvlB